MIDRVWVDVRLPKARSANDFDDGGLGSIAEGTLRERSGGGGIDRCFDSIAVGTLQRTGVGGIDRYLFDRYPAIINSFP